MCFRAAKNSEVWSCFCYSIFVRFLQFLVLQFGLVHYGSDPFISSMVYKDVYMYQTPKYRIDTTLQGLKFQVSACTINEGFNTAYMYSKGFTLYPSLVPRPFPPTAWPGNEANYTRIIHAHNTPASEGYMALPSSSSCRK